MECHKAGEGLVGCYRAPRLPQCSVTVRPGRGLSCGRPTRLQVRLGDDSDRADKAPSHPDLSLKVLLHLQFIWRLQIPGVNLFSDKTQTLQVKWSKTKYSH
ncbi:hypothetical protein J6590_008707 [Homalodisca vitripennis]|nr:hypothetical protein J6590_008707 [Homalodisca vitripennis]